MILIFKNKFFSNEKFIESLALIIDPSKNFYEYNNLDENLYN